jgi:hypothetical protein
VSVASSSQASFFAAHLTSRSFFYWLWLLGDTKASFPTEIQPFSAFLFSYPSRSILDRFSSSKHVADQNGDSATT